MADRSSSSRQQRTIQCAIYTRKSSEGGLEQDFNSLHAQREACEAYIASQRHEGWKLLPARYDDGGYSGDSMERPSLQRLLADMQSGLIDVVVVYKVDRLTRSLMDFARIVEAFDARNASFVSVTQSFNTTTSMGRLTLNVLLSFAQFEREVTGERIRDKIAASKKKGMWMGGFVPMSYTADGRSLRIVDDEADIIRKIFGRFLELESVKDLKAELEREGVTTRQFVSASNRSWGNRPFSIGHLRSILQNPIYVGEVRHRDERYPAQHRAIIDREQFDRVQALISSRARRHRMRLDAQHINLLAGLLYDHHGNRFTCSHTNRRGVRYRYYVVPAGGADGSSPTRIPAGELEQLVIGAVTSRLQNRSWVQFKVLPYDASPSEVADAVDAARRFADHVSNTNSAAAVERMSEIIKSIIIGPEVIAIDLKTEALHVCPADTDDRQPAACTIESENPFVAVGQSNHLVVRHDKVGAAPAKWLVKALARSFSWYDDLVASRATSFRELAEREGVAERYIAKLMPMAFLDPALLKDCLEGRTALSLTASGLALGVELPLTWTEQQR